MRSQSHCHARNPISIVAIAANRILSASDKQLIIYTVLSWYLQKIDKSATQVHRITLKTTIAVFTGFSIMIALSRCSTKLTVRNDVMDLLLTLFLLACCLNKVPGRNDAVQKRVHFFSQAFETCLQGTPIALELATLSQVGSRSAVLFEV
ncbi:hypothetical protein BASA62_002671 [Batrachochytrium salamandrivorans]|nr:hypothetical protein BASA62_002671 [Batrachochytrium salamandrivorans]